MQLLMWLITAGVALFGLPLNLAVIWIYTKKNSKLNKSGQREFPLMFAAIDLIALIFALPLHTFAAQFYIDKELALNELKDGLNIALIFSFNFLFLFAMNGYLFTLITSTVDKFYAVYFPFKYRLTVDARVYCKRRRSVT